MRIQLLQIFLYLDKYCEDNGISPWKLTPKQKEELQQVMGQGRQASGSNARA